MLLSKTDLAEIGRSRRKKYVTEISPKRFG